MKFVADCMLGRLAKWLRILGFDVAYFSKAEDRELLDISRAEDRVLLTRDSGLIERNRKARNRLFVKSENWEDQVVQVLEEYGLWDDIRPNSICLECNRALKPLPKSRAANLVPPYVLEHAGDFALCPGCGRVFWHGTHHRDMEEGIAKILGRKPGPGGSTGGPGASSPHP